MNEPLTNDEMIRVTLTMHREGQLYIGYERQESVSPKIADTIAAGMLVQMLANFKLVTTPKEPT